MITLISVGSGLAFGFGTGYFIAGFFSTDPNGHDYFIDNASEHL